MERKVTATDVMEMLAASAASTELVTSETVVVILRRLADNVEHAVPELREMMAEALGVFLRVTFEVAAKSAMAQVLADASPVAAGEDEDEDDGLD